MKEIYKNVIIGLSGVICIIIIAWLWNVIGNLRDDIADRDATILQVEAEKKIITDKAVQSLKELDIKQSEINQLVKEREEYEKHFKQDKDYNEWAIDNLPDAVINSLRSNAIY